MSRGGKHEEIMGVVVEPENMVQVQDYFMDRYMELEHPVILAEDVSVYLDGEFSLQGYGSFDSYVRDVDPDQVVFGGRIEDIAYADERIDYSDFRIDIDSFFDEFPDISGRDVVKEWFRDKLPFYSSRKTIDREDIEEVLEDYGLQGHEVVSLDDLE